MSRLSIEITPEQHQRLKAVAALHGQSIKDYILERVLPPPTEEGLSPDDALCQLEDLLKPRIEAAERGDVVAKSVKESFEDVRRERG